MRSRIIILLLLAVSISSLYFVVSVEKPGPVRSGVLSDKAGNENTIKVENINVIYEKTNAVINGVNYPDFSVSLYGIPVTYTDVAGTTSVIIPTQNFTYIFLSKGRVIYGLKYDHYGNLIWSKIYNLTSTSVNGMINRLYGKMVNGEIVILFEDDRGLDYSFSVVPDDGSIVDMKLRTVTINEQTLHNDIWTINQNGTFFQSYGRFFNIDLSNYTMVTVNYPYVMFLKNGMVLIINSEDKVTNGGYDYHVMVVDPSTGLVRKSYFFGSRNDDYLWDKVDFIPSIYYGFNYTFVKVPNYEHYNQNVLPGVIQDDNYFYVIIKDGIRNFLGFDLMKVSRDDGSIVWVKRYILPDLVKYNGTYPTGHIFGVLNNRVISLRNIAVSGQETFIELLRLEDEGSYIEVVLREVNVLEGRLYGNIETPIPYMDTLRSAYIIMKINKDDGSISYSSDPKDFYDHGIIAVFDRSNKMGFSYITDVVIDKDNNIYITSIDKCNIQNSGFSSEGLNNVFDGMRTECRGITHDTSVFASKFVSEVDCSYYKFYQVTSNDYLNFGIDIVKLYANDNPNAGNVVVIQDVEVKPVG